MRTLLLLPLTAVLIAAAATTPAVADDVVADDVTRATPIAARAGIVAWSRFDRASQRYRLVLQTGASRVQAPIPGSRKVFDVSMGTDRRGRTVVLYTRCRSEEDRGCDVYRYDVRTRVEQKVAAVSGPTEDEAWPAQSGDLLTFVRRRPRAGTMFEIADCDMPYVKRLSSRAPSRKLDRGACGRTTGMSLRGTRIVQVTVGSPKGATPYVSQVRLLSTRGGAGRVLARQGFVVPENVFASPSQSSSSVWLTRTGIAQPGFVRIGIASGRVSEVAARVGLSGALARDERGTFWYVETPADRDCTGAGSAPCRLTRATSDPFSATERSLTPGMTISAPTDPGGRRVVFGDPFAVSGRLTRSVVSRGEVVRTEPVANAVVRLLRRVDDPSQPGPAQTFVPTSSTTVTGADGRWSIAVTAPPAQPWFSAVTEGQPARTFAGSGTSGSVEARITLTVGAGGFSGTITPAQPGRTVTIYRLTRRTCQAPPPGEQSCAGDETSAIVDARLDGAGTAFTTPAPASPPSGIYYAVLSSAEQALDPEAYGGRSPQVIAGG